MWFDIPGYEGIYEISVRGSIRSVPRIRKTPNGVYYYSGKLLKYQFTKQGYPVVTLSKENKQKNVTIHRIVAMVFIPNTERKREVNHRDGNKCNYDITNLEWCTRKENQLHAETNNLIRRLNGEVLSQSHRNEFKTIIMKDINGNRIKCFESLGSALRYIRITNPKAGDANIIYACKHSNRSAYGYKWEYAT